ncbi:right-handed parallel beta-helix repeat-containing protein [Parasphingopyxis marina]|uniref:Right-handed parallel beta-helix repeat-containing protein n=1 Tax=Parasphingopyxis marina TaxID=2761622 RepID=A0A842I0W8_9SPHN|nr:right-handed parallel beta-helix repeat-containing protein [Parasphingopyxis marina]MBC2778775.1 right-handed parallel beta-helix repeat-containing protein [Parasphingopyxis marina]
MRLSPFILLIALAVTAPLAAQQGAAPFTIEETGQGFARLDQAVAAIGNGEATIVIAPGTYRQCAVQEAGVITFRAAEAGTAIFDGVACEQKAALVLRGRGARIDGLVFQNLRVPDGNGAGIRLEQSDLEVHNSMFRNSEEGILTASDPSASIRIDRSTFSGLGRCDRDLSCAHSIYVGDYGSLEVTRSRFERGRGGHYVKSRAPMVSVTDSSFDDTAGSATNYMIDLPAGSRGEIARNIFVQGEDKENWSAFIAVGAEDIAHSSAGLSIAGNQASIAPGVQRNTWFVADWTGQQLRIGENELGQGITVFDRR